MRKMPIPQTMYVDGLAKVDINCPDCLKSYDGVIIGGIDAPKECECGCEFDLEGLFAGLSCRKPRYCENCEYWADNEVCTNADSENVADFTDRNFQCDFHKFKETDDANKERRQLAQNAPFTAYQTERNDEMKFLFGDIVVVERCLIGVIVKSWQSNKRGNYYEVYVRNHNQIKEYDEDEIERYRVRHKELNEEEMYYQWS